MTLSSHAPRWGRPHRTAPATHRGLRWRWWLVAAALLAWAALWYVLVTRQGTATSWHFFRNSAASLFGAHGDGLHLYARNPQWQFGPVTVVITRAITWVTSSRLAAVGVMVGLGAIGVLLVRLVGHRLWTGRPEADRVDRVVLLGAVAVVPVWLDLAARVAHLDDALAAVLVLAAAYALVRERPVATGVLLAVSAGAKPWAIPFVVMVLAFPGGERWRAAAGWVATMVVCWLPFVVADHHTLAAGSFTIHVQPGSLLALAGVHGSTPTWVRPVQLVVALGLGALAVRRGRVLAVPLVVLLVRLALDPGAHTYYPAAVVAVALLWDVAGRPRGMPCWSWSVAGGLYLTHYLGVPPSARAAVLAATVLAGVVLLCLRSAVPATDTECGPLPSWRL